MAARRGGGCMTNAKELWYLTRGSGAAALVLLTASICIGVITPLRVATARWPRFAVGSVHRNLTLLSIAFVALHVVTTVADGYAPIGLKDAIVPFASPYRPVWLGLGAVAFDLLLALVITTYLRRRIGARMWRAAHWLAYACWPIALLHSLGTGSDARAGWMVVLGFSCLALVGASVLLRVAVGGGVPLARAGGAAAAVALPLGLGIWWHSGPAQPGWARRAGTPTRLIASLRNVRDALASVGPSTSARPPQSFETAIVGTIHQWQGADGYDHVAMSFALAGGPHGQLRIELRGTPVAGGVSMTASGVSFVPATTRAVYLGSVTGL